MRAFVALLALVAAASTLRTVDASVPVMQSPLPFPYGPGLKPSSPPPFVPSTIVKNPHFVNNGACYEVDLSTNYVFASPKFQVQCDGPHGLDFPSPGTARLCTLFPSLEYMCSARISNDKANPNLWTDFRFSTKDDTPGDVKVLSRSVTKTAASFLVHADRAYEFSVICMPDDGGRMTETFSNMARGSFGTADVGASQLAPGKAYTCYVEPVGVHGQTGGKGVELKFRTVGATVGIPGPMAIRSVEERSDSAVLTTTKSTGATSYGIDCRQASNTGKKLTDVRGSTSPSFETFEVRGLSKNQAYFCYVFGKNAAGAGPRLRVQFIAAEGVPPPVKVLRILTGQKVAEIHTTSSNGATKYGLTCWKNGSSAPALEIATKTSAEPGGMKFELSKLNPKTKYSCAISARGDASSRAAVTRTGDFSTKP
jgi:hypothetical protein